MKNVTVTFSLRDWRKGSELLERLGFNRDLNLTDCHEIEDEEDLLEFLHEELEGSGLEFDFDFEIDL